ncbi:MAG TPA: tetratricopeptide repeat protein, partial [Thermoanaerobaculia bacterium]|nr:tetratricopeptide repeat protein [Thermoanaerobaculia bacterium]
MAVQRDKVIANAEKLVAKGKIEPAIKEYERLLEDSPNDVNTLNRIGDLWVRVNRNDEAVKVFGKIADHYSKDGFFLKAIAIFKKINKLDPSKLEIYAKLADLYAKQGLAMEAKSQYQVLADYYLKHGEPSSALGIYRKISELDPTSINVHVKLADLYSQNNQTAEALKEYDRVGRLLLKRGMLDEAVQVFRKALKIDPKNTDLVDSLVTAMLESKDFTNAQLIVDAALEANPNNPRLLAMQGRIQLGRGDNTGARNTLERAVAADPTDTTSREAMADLYLKQNDSDRALEMMAPLAERALAKGERAAAIEILNRILRVEPGHAPTLERMVALYSRLNEETNVLAAMSSLAEAHVARMRFDDAAKVLEKLIQREPQNAQHRNKLQFVRSQMGGLDTVPARSGRSSGPAVELPPMEIDEPTPAFDISDEAGSSFSLDLDSGPALDLGMPTIEARRATPAPPPPMHLMPAVEIAANDLAEGGDDLDFITEHLTEAEVFSKYGLSEKAAEHLRAVLERSPSNLTAHERLFRILLEEGEIDGARIAAQAYADVLEERGESAAITSIRNDFLARGEKFELAPTPVASFKTESSISLDDFAATDDDEMSFDLDAPADEMEFDLEPPPAIEPEPEPEPEPDPGVAAPVMPPWNPPTFEAAAEEPISFESDFAEPQFETPQFEELEEVEEITLGPEPEELTLLPDEDEEALDRALEPMPDDIFIPAPEPEFALPVFDDSPLPAAPEEPFFGVEALGGFEEETLPLEEIGEVDFYIEQELFDEARRKLETLQGRFPDNPDLAARSQRVAAASAAAASAATNAPRPAVFSRDEIESELLSAIPDDDDDFSIPAPPPVAAPAPPPPVMNAALVQEENL